MQFLVRNYKSLAATEEGSKYLTSQPIHLVDMQTVISYSKTVYQNITSWLSYILSYFDAKDC